MTASGLVPREIVPGIEWDEAAERDYLAKLEVLKLRMPEATAAQEAKWAVEGALCRRHISDEVGRANRCRSDTEKKNLYTRWIKLFGEKRAKALARMVKDEKGNKAAMSW
jgi:hypothetical protein